MNADSRDEEILFNLLFDLVLTLFKFLIENIDENDIYIIDKLFFEEGDIRCLKN